METDVLILNIVLIAIMISSLAGLITAIIRFKDDKEEFFIAGPMFAITFGGALLYFGLLNDFWNNPVL